MKISCLGPRSVVIGCSLVFALFAFVLPSAASAQATRTWVSGVGDDANPCSRTAPCKTFAGAISKTASKGEINVLDPGGFGGVTITKAITISGVGVESGVLVSGTNGITVNAGSSDVVRLKGLDFEGLGTGISNGIQFLSGKALIVDDSSFNDFTGAGIAFATNTTSTLQVSNSLFHLNANGILVAPASTGNANASIANSAMINNGNGVNVGARGNVSIYDSVASLNTSHGIVADATSFAASANVVGSIMSFNGGAGVRANHAPATVRIHDNSIIGNNIGIDIADSASVISTGTNAVLLNGTAGTPTLTVPLR